MSSRTAQAIRFRGRSYFALTITPEAPVAEWLGKLDEWLERSPGFFHRNAVILDLVGLELERGAYVSLLSELAARGIRILGVEGAKEDWAAPDLPPLLASGRDVKAMEAEAKSSPEPSPEPVQAEPQAGFGRRAPLILDAPVRSGQSVSYPDGDVIVIGSVASGAEVIAGGSIHVYGALRGRAMAGAYGDEQARIFCRCLEAELIAINGLYQTAEEIDEPLRKRPVQAWLDAGTMRIAKFD